MQAAAALSHRVLSNTTLSFSNIVGPTEEIEFYGHPMVYLAPTVYGHPHVSASIQELPLAHCSWSSLAIPTFFKPVICDDESMCAHGKAI